MGINEVSLIMTFVIPITGALIGEYFIGTKNMFEKAGLIFSIILFLNLISINLFGLHIHAGKWPSEGGIMDSSDNMFFVAGLLTSLAIYLVGIFFIPATGTKNDKKA